MVVCGCGGQEWGLWVLSWGSRHIFFEVVRIIDHLPGSSAAWHTRKIQHQTWETACLPRAIERSSYPLPHDVPTKRKLDPSPQLSNTQGTQDTSALAPVTTTSDCQPDRRICLTHPPAIRSRETTAPALYWCFFCATPRGFRRLVLSRGPG